MGATGVPSAITPSTYASARFAPGKVALPVSGFTGYEQFDHVRGVPADEVSSGLSVSRLFVLDSVFERLAGHADSEPRGALRSTGGVSEAEIAARVERLHGAAERSVYGHSYGNGFYENGMVFSLVR